ncbi:MAG TPA: hypothetical protein VK487_04675 [Candidatus Bathyarchaeia archaeon]|nr:hypothetical protein [Candidatus Bathyarchaeia archaeon]
MKKSEWSHTFRIMKRLYLTELVFIADNLSQDRAKWRYDKRKKSSVAEAIASNVKEEELAQVLQQSCGKRMPSGDTFPDFVQFEDVVFGPLGFLKSPVERHQYDSEIVADILTNYVEGENFLETLADEFQRKMPEQILQTAKSKDGVNKKLALKQLVLTYLTDEEICNTANQLLGKDKIKIALQDLYEDIEGSWIVTRYGLAIRKLKEESINRLVSLARQHYGEHDLEPELRSYSGDFPTRLLEFCIKENPETILRKLFGVPELRKIAKNFGFVVDKIESVDQITALVLLGLGFDVPPPLAGVTASLKSIQKLQKDLSESRDVGWRSGIMSRVFVEMERILRDLAHFYIAFLWRERLDDLRERVEEERKELTARQVKLKVLDVFVRRKFKITKPFERLGFGDLLNLLKIIDKWGQESTSLKRKMTRSFSRTRILEKKEIRLLDSISPFRSSFAHTKDYPGDEKCDEIIRLMEDLVERIRSSKISPLVMRVSREVRDEYGKSYAECVDENGDPWLLYTDEYLETSRPYFVYSKTPNIAVNPVIVEKLF